MRFEIENTKKDSIENIDWLFWQEYETAENQVTEALLKWFYFSHPRVQKRFLSIICGVKGHKANWRRLNLQLKGKKGIPDAVLHLNDGSRLLFEVKIKQNSVSRKQLIRHLRDAGFKKIGKTSKRDPKLTLITPDFREPSKLRLLGDRDRSAILWVPWIEIVNYVSTKSKVEKTSRDRLLREALYTFLVTHPKLSEHLPKIPKFD